MIINTLSILTDRLILEIQEKSRLPVFQMSLLGKSMIFYDFTGFFPTKILQNHLKEKFLNYQKKINVALRVILILSKYIFKLKLDTSILTKF